MFDSRQTIICPTYKPLLENCAITKPDETRAIANRIKRNMHLYDELENQTGIPALFIAALHNLECDGDFGKHLANGDPIDKPTVNEPVGIPAGSFAKTATDALFLKGWVDNGELDWNDKLLWLWRAEKWNGWGYRMYHPETPTPYLWSGTSAAQPGKYVSDGKWDKNATSSQIGCAAVWLELGVLDN